MVTVMHHRREGVTATVVDGLLKRIEHEVGTERRRYAPAHNAPREDIDDERRVDEVPPRGDVRKIGHPELIRARRGEVPLDKILRAVRVGLRLRRGHPRAAPDDTAKAPLPHQPAHRAASHVNLFAPQLPPHFPRPVDLELLVPHPLDGGTEFVIALGPRRSTRRVRLPRLLEEVGRRGDRQHAADRLDPVDVSMVIDEADHHFAQRSSSAWAKYADALRKISFARFSSRFS